MSENIQVKWGSKLEVLADRLWETISETPCAPFEKKYIIVNDPATKNWLKQYFLTDRNKSETADGVACASTRPHCDVFMDLEFVELSEFLNDCLANLVHKTAPRQRSASKHPYSPAVMVWRIYRILEETTDPSGELRELLEYIEKAGKDDCAERRYILSEKLAKLYDDYQNSRPRMLRNWELGRVENPDNVPAWQPALYRMLHDDDEKTYAKDYWEVFDNPNRSSSVSFLPACLQHCKAIHVFDIPFMHEPMLRLLEKLADLKEIGTSRTIPVRFWCFNPKNEWLAESPSIKDAIREYRKTLQEGKSAEKEISLFDIDRFFCDPEERLFGALASGARAVLWNLCNDTQGNVDPAGEDAIDDLKGKRVSVQLHGTYSPRRELEAIRDGLYEFFRENRGASPRDAVVLCGDWEHYAPVIESVFGAQKNPSQKISPPKIPITIAEDVPADEPLIQSFQDILAFRKNRFEVNAVFDLLSAPLIQKKLNLDADAVGVLRDMVKQANIHWGFDDEDVQNVLEMTPEEKAQAAADEARSPYPFTWRRGFDRLIIEMLYGTPENPEKEPLLLNVGSLNDLHPCGRMEGDRAEFAAALWQFVKKLNTLREKLVPGKTQLVDDLKSILLQILDDFYEKQAKTAVLRDAVLNVAEAMKNAGVGEITTDVFLAAVQSKLSKTSKRQPGNSVLFAPLNTYTATPHQLVWICGLNDGVFPKIEHRSSYDLIGKYPSFFDATSRERDAFALLKAVLCARKKLVFSYVAKDISSNEGLPPSVLLNDLMDYFKAVKIEVTEYHHPMRAYSRRYFCKEPDADGNRGNLLPPSYSEQDKAIADLLQKGSTDQPTVIPFPLKSDTPTEINLADLETFLTSPNRYLLESRGAKVPRWKYDRLDDREALSAELNWELKEKLASTAPDDDSADEDKMKLKKIAAVSVETGEAPDVGTAGDKINEIKKIANQKLKFKDKDREFNCIASNGELETFAGAYARFIDANREETVAHLDVETDKGPVLVFRDWTPIEVNNEADGGKRNLLVFLERYTSDQTKNKIWLRHLVKNASGQSVATFVFGAEKVAFLFKPLSPQEAQEKLKKVIELVASPLPPEFPCVAHMGQEDKLPDEWQQKLWQEEKDIISTDQRG